MTGKSKGKRVGIYLRISSLAQLEGFGLDAQEHETRNYAEHVIGGEVVAVWSDVMSGKKGADERKGLSAALDAADDYDILLVREISRFSRSAIEALRAVEGFHKAKVEVRDTKGRSSLDQAQFNIFTAIAQWELDNQRERFAGGQLQAVLNGRFLGGTTPYGYQTDESKRLVIDEAQAANVRKLFDLAGLPDASIIAVYKEAKKRKLRNRDGKPFSRTNIGDILRDRIYVGDGREMSLTVRDEFGNPLEDRRIIPIPAPAIVDSEQFEAVQRALTARRLRYYNPQEKHLWPLRMRILHEHDSGEYETMVGEYHKGRRMEKLYRCSGARPGGNGCPGTSPHDTPKHIVRKSVNAAVAERCVLELGLAMVDQPKVLQDLANDATRSRLAIDAAQETRATLERRLKDIQAERPIALDQNRKGWMDDDQTQRALDDIATRQAEVEQELSDLGTKLDLDELRSELLKIDVLEGSPGWWEANYEPPQPGIMTPDDPKWELLSAASKTNSTEPHPIRNRTS